MYIWYDKCVTKEIVGHLKFRTMLIDFCLFAFFSVT